MRAVIYVMKSYAEHNKRDTCKELKRAMTEVNNSRSKNDSSFK